MTNTRPTPETDAHMLGGSYSFDGDFARKLERERDDALARIDELEGRSAHSCHDQCKRPACVKRKVKDATIADLNQRLIERTMGMQEIIQQQQLEIAALKRDVQPLVDALYHYSALDVLTTEQQAPAENVLYRWALKHPTKTP